MRIRSLKIHNFRALQNVRIENIPAMAIFLGMNGAGKTTFSDVFGFLRDALQGNVQTALAKRGGFREVISRGKTGDIEFIIEFESAENGASILYTLAVGLDENEPVVRKELLSIQDENRNVPRNILDFSMGKGVISEESLVGDGENKDRESVRMPVSNLQLQFLSAPNILAIKGFGQFRQYAAVSRVREYMEDWYIPAFHPGIPGNTETPGCSERLSETGRNLAFAAKYLFENRPDVFCEILETMKRHIPGISRIEAEETLDGRVVLKFADDNFRDPFDARYVSDGTMKMFAYLLLLKDPEKHGLLCAEGPERQLYPHLLCELAEEFRLYAKAGGQVFISTHSPDFLDAAELNELYCLVKGPDGYTKVFRAVDNKLIRQLYGTGDLPGELWRQDVLMGEPGKC